MKTIVSFSLLCALLLLMFLLTPLVKSWGASHPGTLKHASYDLQIETERQRMDTETSSQEIRILPWLLFLNSREQRA